MISLGEREGGCLKGKWKIKNSSRVSLLEAILSTSLTKLWPNLSKEAELEGREEGEKKISGKLQQWHSKALNMRKLT